MKNCYKRVSFWLLSLLGFAGCNGNHIGEIVCMYGVPHGDYKVKSVVTDENGNPLKDIEVQLLRVEKGDTVTEYAPLDTTSTDKHGKATSTHDTYISEQLAIAYRDIDGDKNGGQFLSDTINLDLSTFTAQKKSGEGWYTGEFEKDLKVKLKKEQK